MPSTPTTPIPGCHTSATLQRQRQQRLAVLTAKRVALAATQATAEDALPKGMTAEQAKADVVVAEQLLSQAKAVFALFATAAVATADLVKCREEIGSIEAAMADELAKANRQIAVGNAAEAVRIDVANRQPKTPARTFNRKPAAQKAPAPAGAIMDATGQWQLCVGCTVSIIETHGTFCNDNPLSLKAGDEFKVAWVGFGKSNSPRVKLVTAAGPAFTSAGMVKRVLN